MERVATLSARSSRPPRFIADPMPIASATGTATSAVSAASNRLLGNRSLMTSDTGMLATSDWPGSPLTMPVSQLAYRT